MNGGIDLNPDVAIHFRDQFRKARAAALRDAEAFQEILFTLERLGCALAGKISTLRGDYRQKIWDLARESDLAEAVPPRWRGWHAPFDKLYEVVAVARNDALHHGAFARHLTTHAIQLALVLEDALMKGLDKVSDYMVREPGCAFPWQPISFVRQQMLTNSFTYLPIAIELDGKTKWYLIADYNVAEYLRSDPEQRNRRLATTVAEAIDSGKLKLEEAKCCYSDTSIEEALQISNDGKPVLVFHREQEGQLLGILTSFDLL